MLCFDADSALFDASQYAFFGRDIGEEVELGGLDEEGNSCVPSVDGGFGDEDVQEYHLFEKDEVHSFIFTFKLYILCLKKMRTYMICLLNCVILVFMY